MEAFHASVQFAQASDIQSRDELSQQIARAIEQDGELVIDPSFFVAMKHDIPEINHVEILIKHGRFQNEMTRFRYDVFMHVEPQESEVPVDLWLDWEKDELDLQKLERLLSNNRRRTIGVRAIPNARLATEFRILKWLRSSGTDRFEHVEDLRKSLRVSNVVEVDPELCRDLAKRLSRNLELSYSSSANDKMDVLFNQHGVSPQRHGAFWSMNWPIPDKPWSAFANNPCRSKLAHDMVARLREYCAQRLPNYMAPSSFVMLDTLPLGATGKVNRDALPTPQWEGLDQDQYVAPRSDLERVLSGIWAEQLHVERVGVHDDFFDLGGHSLLATQVINQVRQKFSIDVPLITMFEQPTVAGFAQQFSENLAADANTDMAPPLMPVERHDPLPLSFAQQRLWFLNQLEPGNVAYNMPWAVRLVGDLDLSALEHSVIQLVNRHESLRTTFELGGRDPVQVISAPRGLKLHIEDLSDWEVANKEAQAQQRLDAESRRPFDLAEGPLFRAHLLRLSAREHVLLLVVHHIVCDGWSMDVLYQELAQLYEASCADGEPDLPNLPVQYADYAIWQRRSLQGPTLDRLVDYWKQKLDGIPELGLPLDHPRPAKQTYRGDQFSLRLPDELVRQLQQLSQREGATLFMTMLAAFKVLLFRHCGQDDIAVGTPIANRNRAEVHDLIGFFVNTLVLRTSLSGDPTFCKLLSRVRQTALEAYEHQELPFEKLVEELQPQRDLSRTPLFEVFFNMPLENEKFKLSNLKSEHVSRGELDAKFDLTLYARQHNETFNLQFVFNADLFEVGIIEAMAARFHVLLDRIVHHPDQPLSSLSILTDADRKRCQSAGNDIKSNHLFSKFSIDEVEQSIADRFERQVQSKPQNIAVKTKEGEWTYNHLNHHADGVAQAIIDLGESVGQNVAMLFEPNISMVTGLIGTLKANKTYVPLDTSWPTNRLANILNDAQVRVLLTDSANLSCAHKIQNQRIQILNTDDLVSNKREGDFDFCRSADSVAYIIYTSGSTGQPKGVVQNHRNVLRHIRNYTNSLHISDRDCLTLLPSYSSDSGVQDIFGALLNGATLCLRNYREQSLEHLARWLVDDDITIYHSTPTVYRYLVNTLNGQGEFPKLRLIVLGGEEVNRRDVDRYRQYFSPSCLFVNGFGPTESTVTIQYFVDKQTSIETSSVPVGYPVGDTEVLLLDDDAKPTDIYGEIAIRSPQVALGYWQNPTLTDAFFCPDPDGGDRRIYRTGDLGRLLPDGSIEFMGRKDLQVKIRGFRVELGEIETVLSRHSALGEVVVALRADGADEKVLAAYYVVVGTDPAPTAGDLRHFVQQDLPDYMVPSAYVALAQIPRLANGKPNYRALPDLKDSPSRRSEPVQAPRNETERSLVEIWQEVLDVEEIGIRDDFFELGGHSLLATQVISRVREVFKVELQLRCMFEGPTVERLELLIIQQQAQLTDGSDLKKMLDEVEQLR